MSTRYRKGERFRVRSSGFAPKLHVDTSTQEENRSAVLDALERDRKRAALFPSNCCGSETDFVARLGAKDRRRCQQCGGEQAY